MEVLESFSRFMTLTHTCCIWLGRCRTSQCDTLTHYKHNIYMNIHYQSKVSSAHEACIYLIQNTAKTVIL